MWLQMVAPEPRFLVPEPILLALLARSEYGRQQAWPEGGEEDTKECTKPRGKSFEKQMTFNFKTYKKGAFPPFYTGGPSVTWLVQSQIQEGLMPNTQKSAGARRKTPDPSSQLPKTPTQTPVP